MHRVYRRRRDIEKADIGAGGAVTAESQSTSCTVQQTMRVMQHLEQTTVDGTRVFTHVFIRCA